MNIESSHKLTRSGDTASGCIEGVNMEDYQVGVVRGKQAISTTTTPTDTASTSSSSLIIIYIVVGIVLGVLLGVLLLLIVIIILLWKRRQKKRVLHPVLSPESPLPTQTNTYETVSPRGTRAAGVHEGTFLFQVVLDGSTARQTNDSAHAHDATLTSTSPPPYSPPGREGDSTSPPPVPPPRTNEDPNVVAYAETMVSNSATAPPPTEAEKVVYHEVGAFQNAQGHHYTLISNLPTRTSVVPDDPHNTVYSEIKPQDPSSDQVATTEMSASEEQCVPTTEADTTNPSTTPFTLEHIVPEVMPMASKWQALGEALSLDEDCLDEIFTNNDTDEACLRVMLELYMKRSDLKHSWEEIRGAKKKVEDNTGLHSTPAPAYSGRSSATPGFSAIKPRKENNELHIYSDNNPQEPVVRVLNYEDKPAEISNTDSGYQTMLNAE